ncbi:hypothetical protein KCTC52924_02914 [Arenibacter antarcticus]|uniref:Polysaccharide deacetylase family protein n=1 Tax=Arenibacter antarcticus TaxID=2040469 RepID=A0ABW5VHR6_9FLAO|nr:polysaccharide deacetylase family protein [Arenibacter sp. H213]MCM4167330.1 polysaccharide deacetylase [Arenibacter sp. H213]
MGTAGQFVISLDFELFWGVRDKRRIEDYGSAMEKVHEIVPNILELFREYEIKATFATVGLLFAKDRMEMTSFSPSVKPQYRDSNLSPYTDGFKLVKSNADEDPYHFALPLIEMIRDNYPEHEIGTHTFSHYYCQEVGQTVIDFKADLTAAIEIAKAKGMELHSLVFPRNQYNPEYLAVCREMGIWTYRGNEKAWYYAPDSKEGTTLKKKIYRTLDCYVNISGHNCYTLSKLKSQLPYNIPSSRFFRPYAAKGGRLVEYLKLKRIKESMTHAAKNNSMYHLWWHPHNFGQHTEQNMETLKSVLEHYKKLQLQYGFKSVSMKDCATLIDNRLGTEEKAIFG